MKRQTHVEYRVLVGTPEGHGLLEISRRRWEDNIKADLKSYAMDWIGLTQGRDK